MLLQFTVENCLSFRDRTTLSMVAAAGSSGPAVHTNGGDPLARVAAVYGPNASGKSNLVRALAMARRLIVDGTRPGQPIERTPFKLDHTKIGAPSRFEFDLRLGGTHWSYAFLVDEHAVHAERLVQVRDGEEVVAFSRERNGDGDKVELGTVFSTNDERRAFLGFVAEGTRPNQLFLTELTERNAAEAHSISSWFRADLHVVPPTLNERAMAMDLIQRAQLREFSQEFLAAAGTGIQSIDLVVGAGSLDRAFERLKIHNRVVDVASLLPEVDDLRLGFVHSTRNGNGRLLLPEESDGTRRLLELAPVVFAARLADGPRLSICDELDRSLHTLMTRHFLEAFLAAGHDRGTQLIFTTHDTNLLDANLLPREAIWFVEKDDGGGSSLYSLAEFKPEQLDALTNDLEKGYLNGRFGAVPFLGDPRKLGWTNEPATR